MSNLYLKEISPADYPALAAYRQAYLNRQLVAHGCGDLENYDDMAAWHQRQVAMTKRETLRLLNRARLLGPGLWHSTFGLNSR